MKGIYVCMLRPSPSMTSFSGLFYWQLQHFKRARGPHMNVYGGCNNLQMCAQGERCWW